ncbi:MAG TPA: ABC transporter substrate-binding protein [Desulfosporosinus sp.]|nr:ABC transporter substrate-binding protein [Desulfosporosinus sp.]
MYPPLPSILTLVNNGGAQLRIILHYIDLVSECSGKFISLLIIVLNLIIGYEVIARYVLNAPTIWVHEASGMLFGTYIVLGAAYILSIKGHVNMDLVYNRLSRRQQAFIDIITFGVFAAFCVALIFKGGERALYSIRIMEHSSSIWGPPLYPIKIMLPIGAFLLLLQGIAKFARDVTTLVKGEER